MASRSFHGSQSTSKPSLPLRQSSKHAPDELAQGGEVAAGNVGGEKGQIDVVGREQAVRGVIEALFGAPILGFVEGQSLEIVDTIAEPLARLEKQLGRKIIV